MEDQNNIQETQSSSDMQLSVSDTRSSSYFKRLYQGRVNRRNYLAGMLLINGLVYFLSSVLSSFVVSSFVGSADLLSFVEPASLMLLIPSYMVAAVGIVYLMSLQIRRLHDANLSGWFSLLGVIPRVAQYFIYGQYGYYFYYLLIAIELLFILIPGTHALNKYGEPPMDRLDINSIFNFRNS